MFPSSCICCQFLLNTDGQAGELKIAASFVFPSKVFFIMEETKNGACQARHNAVQITCPLERTNVLQNILNAVQLCSSSSTFPNPHSCITAQLTQLTLCHLTGRIITRERSNM